MNRVDTSRCASAANACSCTCFSNPYSSRFGESAIFSRAPAQARQPRASRGEAGCFRCFAVSTGRLPAGIAGAQATVAAQPFEHIAFHAVDILDRGKQARIACADLGGFEPVNVHEADEEALLLAVERGLDVLPEGERVDAAGGLVGGIVAGGFPLDLDAVERLFHRRDLAR